MSDFGGVAWCVSSTECFGSFYFHINFEGCNEPKSCPSSVCCIGLSPPGPLGEGNNPFPGLTKDRTPGREQFLNFLQCEMYFVWPLIERQIIRCALHISIAGGTMSLLQGHSRKPNHIIKVKGEEVIHSLTWNNQGKSGILSFRYNIQMWLVSSKMPKGELRMSLFHISASSSMLWVEFYIVTVAQTLPILRMTTMVWWKVQTLYFRQLKSMKSHIIGNLFLEEIQQKYYVYHRIQLNVGSMMLLQGLLWSLFNSFSIFFDM